MEQRKRREQRQRHFPFFVILPVDKRISSVYMSVILLNDIVMLERVNYYLENVWIVSDI